MGIMLIREAIGNKRKGGYSFKTHSVLKKEE